MSDAENEGDPSDPVDLLLVGGPPKRTGEVVDAETFEHAHAIAHARRSRSEDYRPALRDYLITSLAAQPANPADRAGVFVYRGLNYDLRVAFARGGFYKYNRIHIQHDIDVFLLTAYRLTWATLATGGRFFVFRVPRDSMLRIVRDHGRGGVSLRAREGDAAWRALLPFSIKLL
jgi:hypothetical protein